MNEYFEGCKHRSEGIKEVEGRVVERSIFYLAGGIQYRAGSGKFQVQPFNMEHAWGYRPRLLLAIEYPTPSQIKYRADWSLRRITSHSIHRGSCFIVDQTFLTTRSWAINEKHDAYWPGVPLLLIRLGSLYSGIIMTSTALLLSFSQEIFTPAFDLLVPNIWETAVKEGLQLHRVGFLVLQS